MSDLHLVKVAATWERSNGLSGCVKSGECLSEEPLFVASQEGPSCTELVCLFARQWTYFFIACLVISCSLLVVLLAV